MAVENVENFDSLEETLKLLLDTQKLDQSRIDLITNIFTLSSTTTTSPSENHKLLNILPALLWLYSALPYPKDDKKTDDQFDSYSNLSTLLDVLETCFIGYYQRLDSATPLDCSRPPNIQHVLDYPCIYSRVPVYPLHDPYSNPNLLPARVSHQIPSNCYSHDTSIDSFTMSTRPLVFEALLRLFESHLNKETHPDSLLIMLLFIERIICTDLVNTPVPYLPDIGTHILSSLPEHIQMFYKSSLFIWGRISKLSDGGSNDPRPSPSSPLPPNKVPYRFSISTVTPSRSRKHSIPDPLRPTTASSAYSQLSTSNNNLMQIPRISHPTDDLPPPAYSPMNPSSTTHQSINLEFPPRLILTRESYRLILSIIVFCKNYVPSKQALDFPTQVPDTYSGFWATFISQSGSKSPNLIVKKGANTEDGDEFERKRSQTVHDGIKPDEKPNGRIRFNSDSTLERDDKEEKVKLTYELAFQSILKRLQWAQNVSSLKFTECDTDWVKVTPPPPTETKLKKYQENSKNKYRKLEMSFAIGNTSLASSRLWHLVDARGQILGHLSRGIASALTGELKPIYTPYQDIGDHVVVINAKDVLVSGDKRRWKIMYSHSGYPGGMKEITLGDMLNKKPDEVIWRAVSGMMPKDNFRSRRMDRLHIFKDDKHPFAKNLARWHEFPELESMNSRMLHDMSGEDYERLQDEMHKRRLEDLLLEYQMKTK